MWQTASDFLIFLGWAWQNITLILKSVFLPIQYIFTFLKSLFGEAISRPVEPEIIWTWTGQVQQVFSFIPYWSTITLVLGVALTILILVFILKTFLRSQTSTMPQKPSYKSNKAIKWGFLIGLLWLFPLITQAGTSFEDYELGDLDSQHNWTFFTGEEWQVVDTKSSTGQNSLFCGGAAKVCGAFKTGAFIPTGQVAIDFFIDSNASNPCERIIVRWFATTPTLLEQFGWRTGLSDETCKLAVRQGEVYTYLFEISYDTWHTALIQWEDLAGVDGQFRIRLDSGNFSDWYSAFNNFYGVDRIYLESYYTGYLATKYHYLDNIKDTCSEYTNQSECQNVGCIWYFNEWLFVNNFVPYAFCVDPLSVEGECGSEWDTCQYCISQGICEAQDFCYWWQDSCHYGTGSCAEGLQVQFCDNQTECENAGGFWYEDFCWLSPKPSLFDFDDYYSEHGDYATPTAWILGVASSTAGFFNTIGGFLTTFRENFDLQSAYTKGKMLGSAVPVARGYMTIFNDFLGGLPLGELFLFVLIFMLAIGVFRIVRNLIQLLKFW